MTHAPDNHRKEIFMMNMIKTQAGASLQFTLSGRLDTITAPKLEAELRSSLTGVTDLTLDFSEIEYISSAGLRVLLAAQKIMNKQGKMLVKNVSEEINEIFEITGFVDILTIE